MRHKAPSVTISRKRGTGENPTPTPHHRAIYNARIPRPETATTRHLKTVLIACSTVYRNAMNNNKYIITNIYTADPLATLFESSTKSAATATEQPVPTMTTTAEPQSALQEQQPNTAAQKLHGVTCYPSPRAESQGVATCSDDKRRRTAVVNEGFVQRTQQPCALCPTTSAWRITASHSVPGYHSGM